MNIRKIFLAILFASLAVFLVCIFSNWSVFLCGVILVLAVGKHLIIPIKSEWLIFVLAGPLGTIAEGVVIYFCLAWSYARPEILGLVPYWLPFLWGLAGICGISLFEGLTSSRK